MSRQKCLIYHELIDQQFHIKKKKRTDVFNKEKEHVKCLMNV